MPDDQRAGWRQRRQERIERKRVSKLAESLGQGLGRKRPDGRWAINGHHGTASTGNSLIDRGCGTYDLVLNEKEKRVDCASCGATDLVKVAR